MCKNKVFLESWNEIFMCMLGLQDDFGVTCPVSRGFCETWVQIFVSPLAAGSTMDSCSFPWPDQDGSSTSQKGRHKC